MKSRIYSLSFLLLSSILFMSTYFTPLYSVSGLLAGAMGLQVASSTLLNTNTTSCSFTLPGNQTLTFHPRKMGLILSFAAGTVVLLKKQNICLKEIVHLSMLATVAHYGREIYKGTYTNVYSCFYKGLPEIAHNATCLALPFILYSFTTQPPILPLVYKSLLTD